MESDERARRSERPADFPLNAFEWEVIHQLRELVRAFKRVTRARVQARASSADRYAAHLSYYKDISLSKIEADLLHALRRGIVVDESLIKFRLRELVSDYANGEFSKNLLHSQDGDQEDTLHIDFATAAALCLIEATERSRPYQPMPSEERTEAMEGMRALREKAREARADLR